MFRNRIGTLSERGVNMLRNYKGPTPGVGLIRKNGPVASKKAISDQNSAIFLLQGGQHPTERQIIYAVGYPVFEGVSLAQIIQKSQATVRTLDVAINYKNDPQGNLQKSE